MNKPSDVLEIRESNFYNEYAKKDIKIASIGDIHLSKLVGEKDINNINETLHKENPDYICLLGDIIDSPKELTIEKNIENLNTLIKNCSSIAPTMIIIGNHDYEKNSDLSDELNIWNEINKIRNVYVLNDNTYSDKRILIGGYTQKREAYGSKRNTHHEDSIAFYNDFISHSNLYEELKDDVPKILLTHSPESINNLKVEELLSVYDLIITGHYHNGCVPSFLENIYPKNAGIITPKFKVFPKTARGIIKLESGNYLIYSGGWTKLSSCSPIICHPLDTLCNRQIDVITLTSNKEYKNESIKTKKLVLKK